MITTSHRAFITLVISSAWLSSTAQAQWTVTNLHPAGNIISVGQRVGAGQQVGEVFVPGPAPIDYLEQASLWSGSAGSWVNLNPTGAVTSFARGVSGGQQVGWIQMQTGGWRASLWTGTAASWVNLHPIGVSGQSIALGVSEGQQVGSLNGHATLWSGTSASAVDLHPAVSTVFGSSARSIGGGQQVGAATIGDNPEPRASLWTGSAASWVNLNPAGAYNSEATDVDAGQQVGIALTGGKNRASLWTGTAASWVDLSSPAMSYSRAKGVHAGMQVGEAKFADTTDHAIIWNSTAASWEDLSLALTGSWGTTQANDIWSDGSTVYVVGLGDNLISGHTEALMWTRPVPEFGTAMLPVAGLLIVPALRRVRTRE